MSPGACIPVILGPCFHFSNAGPCLGWNDEQQVWDNCCPAGRPTSSASSRNFSLGPWAGCVSEKRAPGPSGLGKKIEIPVYFHVFRDSPIPVLLGQTSPGCCPPYASDSILRRPYVFVNSQHTLAPSRPAVSTFVASTFTPRVIRQLGKSSPFPIALFASVSAMPQLL